MSTARLSLVPDHDSGRARKSVRLPIVLAARGSGAWPSRATTVRRDQSARGECLGALKVRRTGPTLIQTRTGRLRRRVTNKDGPPRGAARPWGVRAGSRAARPASSGLGSGSTQMPAGHSTGSYLNLGLSATSYQSTNQWQPSRTGPAGNSEHLLRTHCFLASCEPPHSPRKPP